MSDYAQPAFTKNPAPFDKAPRAMDKSPKPIKTAPAKMDVPKYTGHSGNFGVVGKVVEKGVHNVVKAVEGKGGNPKYDIKYKGKVAPGQHGPGLDKQAASLIGVNPKSVLGAVEHPVRFVQHQQKLSPQQKADSAIGTHLLAGLVAGPKVGGAVERAGSRKGLATALSGGGKEMPEEAAIVRGGLRGAKIARGKQDILHSEERAARAAKLHAIYTDASIPVSERERRASEVLRGELPKHNYPGIGELTPETVDKLKAHVMEHPNLLPYQKKRVVVALNKMSEGEVPQRNEITLIEHVFGKDTADSLRKGDSLSAWDNMLRVANIPRSLMASFDVSAPLRQGLAAYTRHPVISTRNIGPMFKALKSEDYYQNTILGGIEKRPTYPLMLEAKLAITKLGREVGPREERFPTDLAEKIPVAGKAVRGSGRAYTGYLDKTRADIFDHLLSRAQAQNINIHDEKFLHDLGSIVNNMTGRGDLGAGAIHEAGKLLNTVFFSPRLLASRVNIIAAPVRYARADPFVRKEALKTWFSLAGTLTSVLAAMSQIPGVKVEMDPRNPDWGKIRKGNTRIDLAGGFQQPLRLAAQIATGEAISSTTGKKLNLTANGFGQPTRLDLIMRFFEGKEAPAPSLLTDWMRNSNQVGQKFSWKSEVGQRVVPLLAQDAYDLYKDRKGGTDGITAAFLGYGVGAFGVGLQTYGPKVPKVKGSGSSDPYTSGSNYAQSSYGSGGSDYAQSP